MKIIDNFSDTISNEEIYKELWDSDGVFLDIETTGLKRESSSVYLIGLLFPCFGHPRGNYDLKLLFAETPEEEPLILEEFRKLLDSGSYTIITFNGERFDIPFLLKRCQICNTEPPVCLKEGRSFDIYRHLKNYRRAFGLPHLNQKSVEQMLGINREDIYSGGELIPVYYEYIKTKDPVLENALLTHNAEDVQGMAAILPALNYAEIFRLAEELRESAIISDHSSDRPCELVFGQDAGPYEIPDCGIKSHKGSYEILDCGIKSHKGFDGQETKELVIRFSLPSPVPLPRLFHDLRLFLSVQESEGELHVPLFSGELKHFFDNYRDYFYIPSDDTAVLKTIGRLMENVTTENAKASNCYIRKNGDFIPLPEGCGISGLPLFKKEYKGKNLYIPVEDSFSGSPECREYLIMVLSKCFR